MKRILNVILSAVCAVLSAVSCIEETIPIGSSVTQAQVSASKSALKSMINSIPATLYASGVAGYASSYGDHTDFGIPGVHLRMEHMLEDLATMSDNPYYNRFYAYDMNMAQGSEYTYCAYFWDYYYTLIRLANDVIASMKPIIDENGTDQEDVEFKHIIGQAYAYRAWFYLDLARLYEPKLNKYTDVRHIAGLTVPIVDEYTTIDDTKGNPRVPREEMYKFIFDDLARAEKYLDKSKTTFTAPTLMAVYGLYARAYIELGAAYKENKGVNPNPDILPLTQYEAYAKAAEYARKVIDESGKTPLTQAQWEDPSNGFNNGTSQNAWIWGITVSSEVLNNLLTYISHMSAEAAWGYGRYAQFGSASALYDQIPDADFRKHSWLDPERTDYYDYKFAGSEEDRDNFLNGAQPAKSYVALKFRPAQGECSDFNIGNAGDYCLMRIEEMYFIEMEAKANLQFTEGVKLLQDFMKEYRYSSYDRNPSTWEDFKTEYMLQKRIEFWGEGILMFDYKRLDVGINRAFAGSNHPSVFRLGATEGRSPQWNIVVTRVEFQSNTAITDETNNPDPSNKIPMAEE
ncbi:MAG: RagB/SusD family nutrient uptake outer membrane protein [Bacteroidales bacterium]|nr:RagB/SusD family nutrient uptake outer membrane protein [Bacteroidales bacterium]